MASSFVQGMQISSKSVTRWYAGRLEMSIDGKRARALRSIAKVSPDISLITDTSSQQS
jgi:hypothetical protein